MLEILAHRGWWKRRDEQNEIVAFERAFEAGYGVETDVRDLNGVLVISHDMAKEGGLTLDQMLDIHRAFGRPGVLALNVKCDGLCAPLVEAISRSKVERYFVFDMSVPDTLKGEGNLKVELNFAEFGDFHPEAIVKQVPRLAKLLEARQQLRDLLGKLDGNDELDSLLENIIQNSEELAALKGSAPAGDTAAAEATADAPEAPPAENA